MPNKTTGSVKLADFGLAKMFRDKGSTTTSEVFGTRVRTKEVLSTSDIHPNAACSGYCAMIDGNAVGVLMKIGRAVFHRSTTSIESMFLSSSPLETETWSTVDVLRCLQKHVREEFLLIIL